jgi:acid stress chaperone HdeB
MKYLSTLAIAVAVLAAAPAQAAEQKVDLSVVTCKQFFEYSKENLSLMLMWLDGYYKSEDDDPIIDFDKMADTSKKLGEYCGKHPDDDVITGAEKVLGK